MKDYIYFYLPGWVDTIELNAILIMRMEQFPHHFRDNLKIGAVYGCPPGALWNGGRYAPGYTPGEDLDKIRNFYRDYNIPMRFTWTNPVLETADLNDEYCNSITAAWEDGLNEILVNNQQFEDYIRNTYPSYPLISSTTKRITNIDDLNHELQQDYRLVVLDYDFNNKWDLLDKIERPEKCEILLNPVCNPNCPRRKAHYQTIGRMQKGLIGVGSDEEKQFDNCPAYKRHLTACSKLSNFISWEAIEQEYIPRGFRHFKIEGRTQNPLYILDYYIHYLVKEEYQQMEREQLYIGFLTHIYEPNVRVYETQPSES